MKFAVEEAFRTMYGLVTDRVTSLALRECCRYALGDPRFAKGYGSSVDTSHKHHAYSGGLVVHTAEVVTAAVSMGETVGADLDVLITAAIWHDFAKIHDYDEHGNGTKYRDLIRHVSGSFAEFTWYWDVIEHPKYEEISHCILAHHGRKEWGSPVEPQTKEAACLHYADMLSMQFGAGR